MNPEIERIFKAKEDRRRQLAALPWPDKVRIVVRMQRMIVPILKDRDPRARIWEIPGWEDEAPTEKRME